MVRWLGYLDGDLGLEAQGALVGAADVTVQLLGHISVRGPSPWCSPQRSVVSVGM